MKKVCDEIQEQIAIGIELGEQERPHLKNCAKCSRLLDEYQSLGLLASDVSEIQVPEGFADTVMNRIESEERATSDWWQGVTHFFDRLLTVPETQYVALGLGSAVSVLNLIRFVFFVLIPA